MSGPLLETRGLSKSYTAPVLREFDFDLWPGEVHALVGSNGAGKSTFARILCGLVAPDSGSMLLRGQPHAPRSRREAESSGVVMVMQELNVIPTLTVAENIFLDRLPSRFGFIRYDDLNAAAGEALGRVGLDVDPNATAGALGLGRQQMVEIATALDRRCGVLILDEPTAALSQPEIKNLFENIGKLRANGAGIIYISHRMHEIRQIADRVTVLRDGRRISVHAAASVEQAVLIREMAGHEVSEKPAAEERAAGEVVLAASGVCSSTHVNHVNLEVRSGEILGIAGLVGSGRSELLRAIYDSAFRDAGEVRLGRAILEGGPATSVRAGLCLVPEDRKTEGLLLPQSLRVNLTLASLDRHSKVGWIRPGLEEQSATALAETLKVQAASTEQPSAELSGGNQQKIVLGRWLARDFRALLLDEPTRGVDAAAKDQIHNLLRRLANEGKAIVVVSSELEELMALCSRILVLSAGRITGEFMPGTWTKNSITDAAFAGYSRS